MGIKFCGQDLKRSAGMSLDPLLRLVHGIPNSLNYNCGPHMGDLKPLKMNIFPMTYLNVTLVRFST